jgi:hypothetical protein
MEKDTWIDITRDINRKIESIKVKAVFSKHTWNKQDYFVVIDDKITLTCSGNIFETLEYFRRRRF